MAGDTEAARRQGNTTMKPNISMYWAASCGGCEIALVNIHEKIFDLEAHFNLVFCPCLLDTKKRDLEAMPDKSIALTFFNGAIRTSENEEMAHILRRKSETLIAFGSCSSEGCIPGLSNLSTADDHMRTIYLNNPSLDNPSGTLPHPETAVKEGIMNLPSFFNRVRTLAQTVDVDYRIPGCPPEPHQIWKIIQAVIQGDPLPPKGGVLGAGTSTVCEECEREKGEKKIKRLYRTYELVPDTVKCLLEQGIICMGIATRDGCGALCPRVNMPCTGCYGPPEGIRDQGAKMVAALGSVLDVGDIKGMNEQEIRKKVDEILDAVPDLVGTFYKYSLADSLLKGMRL
jgi:F420-non-reducing hydrogenase small subunit